MNREFLKGLGLEDEAIEKIMAEHGKTVNSTKDELDTAKTDLDKLKEEKKDWDDQIKQRDKQLEELGNNATGNKELESQIAGLKQANEDAKKSYEAKIKQQNFEHTLENSLLKANTRNPIAVKPFLQEAIDGESIRLNDNGELIGLDEQLEKLKESDGYLFEDVEDDSDNDDGVTYVTHVPGNKKKINNPKKTDPHEAGRLKAQERFKKEEAE